MASASGLGPEGRGFESHIPDNMFYVYVLKSLRNNKRYIGFTGKLPEERLVDHNNGSNKFTSLNKPWILLYSEEYLNKKEALQREKFLKSGQGRKILTELLKD